MSSPLSFDLNSGLVVLAFGTFLCVAHRLISALCFLLFIAISHRFGQGMNMKQILCLCSILEWIDMNDNLMVDDIRWLQHNDLFGKSGSQEKTTFNMSNRFQALTFSTFFLCQGPLVLTTNHLSLCNIPVLCLIKDSCEKLGGNGEFGGVV